jgi:hypothetical protein
MKGTYNEQQSPVRAFYLLGGCIVVYLKDFIWVLRGVVAHGIVSIATQLWISRLVKKVGRT